MGRDAEIAMTDRFVFQPNPGVQNVLNALSTPRGGYEVGRIASEFSSLVDVLHHTQAVGDSTVIHMPDGNNVAFVHAAPRTVAAAAYDIAVVNGLKLS